MTHQLHDTATSGLQKWADDVKASLETVLFESAQRIEADSVKRCPKDTGQLRRNHTVIRADDGSPTVIVAYEVDVPPDQRYGLEVHECPSSAARYAANLAAHRYRRGNKNRGVPWDIGEDHFLRNAVNAHTDATQRALVDRMRRWCR